MREQMLDTLRVYFSGNIMKHKMNVEIMLDNPMAIHDHTDFMSAIEHELAHIAEYQDKLEALESL